MALGHLWAGQAFGTNTGNLFVKLYGSDESLTGTVHLNDPAFGLTVYRVSGAFDGDNLKLTGQPEVEVDEVILGQISASAMLDARGVLNGEWSTDLGSIGTFILYPHDQHETIELDGIQEPEQLHTARYKFGAVVLDRNQISVLADEMQANFPKSQVVVTVVADTEQTRLLSDFKLSNYSAESANIIKLYAQQSETNGINRVSVVEFGPEFNMAMAQGADEAWALGMLEKLKRHIQPLERTYTTNFKKYGVGINQFLLVSAIIFLPSLETLKDRAVLMIGVLSIIFGVNWLHRRFLPHAVIYLKPKPKSAIVAHLASWLIAVTSALAAALLAAYLLQDGQLPSQLLQK